MDDQKGASMALRKVLLSMTLALLMAAISGAVDSDAVARAAARVTKGDSALIKGNYGEAEKCYRKAVEFAPELPSAYLGLGAALVGQRRYGEALEALAEAEQRFIEYEKLLAESARLGIESMEDTERQLVNFMEAYGVFQRGPSNQILSKRQVEEMNIAGASSIPAHLYYLQGVAYLRTGDKVAGIDNLEHCLMIDGDHGLAHHNLAVALYSIGRYQEANSHLQQAIAAGVEPSPMLIADLEARSLESKDPD
jgi:tetratricopeptide (TPR) repeat protein